MENSKFKELINNNILFYDNRVSIHGTSYKSLNWGSKESQNLRFKILTTIGDLIKKNFRFWVWNWRLLCLVN